MICPHCGHLENRVLDTRIQKEGDIRRRRECIQCKGRFSTVESLLLSYPHIVKKDGRREPFSKEKLQKGIRMACQKRPVSLAQVDQLVQRVARQLLDRSEKEIESKIIGLKVMKELKSLDHVAYVRFASVYRTFKDINEFVESLESEPQQSGQPVMEPQI